MSKQLGDVYLQWRIREQNKRDAKKLLAGAGILLVLFLVWWSEYA